jgi:hypothetical protein
VIESSNQSGMVVKTSSILIVNIRFLSAAISRALRFTM